jgi:biopolymer transport protein ExbD
MANPSRDPDPQPLLTLNMTPFAGVVLSLLAVWIAALPPPLHAVSLDITGHCGGSIDVEPVIHILRVDFDGTVSWNGEILSSRAALDARLQAVAAVAMTNQVELHVQPHKLADFGAVTAVLAAAQRNGVRKLGLIGEDFTVLPSRVGSPI